MRVVSGAADQHEATIAIAAFDKAFFVDFEPDARMAERGGHITRAIASDTHGIHTKDFWGLVHAPRLATHNRSVQKVV
jgi:hypothetical protein